LNLNYHNISTLPTITEDIDIVICGNTNINNIDNFPETVKEIHSWDTKIVKCEKLPKNLIKLDVHSNSIKSIEKLPQHLEMLNISGNYIKHIDLPKKLKRFYCQGNYLRHISLPKSIEKAFLAGNFLSAIKVHYGCTVLDIERNIFTKIPNYLPDTLTTLKVLGNNIEIIENLPNNLQIFTFTEKYVKFVDNVSIDKINFTLKGYNAIKKLQKQFKIKMLNNVRGFATPKFAPTPPNSSNTSIIDFN
jgi:hypothetical protein